MLRRFACLTCASSVMLVVSACASGPLDPGLTLASVAVESLSDLPACNPESEGEVRFVASEETLYACVTSEWRKVPNKGPAGPQGATGAKGPKGNTGAKGATGKPGLTSLIRTVPLDEDSTQCPGIGGISIETGIDANANNVLDPAEVQAPASAVCNGSSGPDGHDGEDGVDGHDTLIITTPEPAGTNCVNGGVRVDSGTDQNDDGVLSPNEIKLASFFICNVTGVRIRPVPAGAICRNGGSRIDVGIDQDGNGELSDAEVTSSEFLCDAMRFTKVSTGAHHTCAIASDGRLYCWGSNSNGQVGPDVGVTARIPKLVEGVGEVVDAVAGNAHTCAVLRDSTVRCWGFNATGQLGNNTYTASTSPVTVVETDGTPLAGATAIVAGSAHTCALVGDRVRCWGNGGNGERGDNTIASRSTPSKVLVKSGSSIVELTGVTALYGGWSHSCALVNGRARCWGSNTVGQLGNNSKRYSTTAVFVVGPTGSEALTGIKSIAPGVTHSCAVVGTGALCWGKNDLGQLGNGTYISRLLPAKVVTQSGTALSDVRAISTTAHSTCAVVGTARGAVCWGGDNYGILGNGSTTSGPTPTPVVGLSDVESVHGNNGLYDSHVCARLANSRVSCWGDNRSGQLGNGTSSNQSSVPTEVWNNW